MALFFDYEWFDDRLRSLGLGREALARNAGMTVDEIDMVFDDRRQINFTEINAFAETLSVSPEIVAKYCGVGDLGLEQQRQHISEPMMTTGDLSISREMIMGIHERLDRLESLVEMVLTKLDARG